jgi:hypothetical protein
MYNEHLQKKVARHSDKQKSISFIEGITKLHIHVDDVFQL